MKAFGTNNRSFQLVQRIPHVLCQLSVRKSSWREVSPVKKIFPPFSDLKVGEVNICSEIPTLGIANAHCCSDFLHCLLDCYRTYHFEREHRVLRKIFSVLAKIIFLCQPRFSDRCLSENPSFLLLRCILVNAILR